MTCWSTPLYMVALKVFIVYALYSVLILQLCLLCGSTFCTVRWSWQWRRNKQCRYVVSLKVHSCVVVICHLLYRHPCQSFNILVCQWLLICYKLNSNLLVIKYLYFLTLCFWNWKHSIWSARSRDRADVHGDDVCSSSDHVTVFFFRTSTPSHIHKTHSAPKGPILANPTLTVLRLFGKILFATCVYDHACVCCRELHADNDRSGAHCIWCTWVLVSVVWLLSLCGR